MADMPAPSGYEPNVFTEMSFIDFSQSVFRKLRITSIFGVADSDNPSQKGDEFIFPVADVTATLSGRDYEFREPTQRRKQTVGSEESEWRTSRRIWKSLNRQNQKIVDLNVPIDPSISTLYSTLHFVQQHLILMTRAPQTC